MYRVCIFIILFFLFNSCVNGPNCNSITIINNWSEYNNGLPELEIVNELDRQFICERIAGFPEGRKIMVAYNHGYFQILGGGSSPMLMIFTQKKGVVYRVGFGKYVYDDALTAHIMKLMKIKKREW